jgi:hypothetical protein
VGSRFNLGNAVKYVARAGKKDPAKRIEDLRKAQWYLQREIDKSPPPITSGIVPTHKLTEEEAERIKTDWLAKYGPNADRSDD